MNRPDAPFKFIRINPSGNPDERMTSRRGPGAGWHGLHPWDNRPAHRHSHSPTPANAGFSSLPGRPCPCGNLLPPCSPLHWPCPPRWPRLRRRCASWWATRPADRVTAWPASWPTNSAPSWALPCWWKTRPAPAVGCQPSTSKARRPNTPPSFRPTPHQANLGVPAPGSLPHFFALMVGDAAQVRAEAVGYRGSAPLLTDLIGGQLPVAFDSFDSLLPQHEAGKIRILAVSSARRSPLAADIPTFRE